MENANFPICNFRFCKFYKFAKSEILFKKLSIEIYYIPKLKKNLRLLIFLSLINKIELLLN